MARRGVFRDGFYIPYGYGGKRALMLNEWLTAEYCHYCGCKLILPFTPKTTTPYYDYVTKTITGHTSSWWKLSDEYGLAVVDHDIPRALGGTEAPDNLVWACARCNNNKRTMTGIEYLCYVLENHLDRWRRRSDVMEYKQAVARTAPAAAPTEGG